MKEEGEWYHGAHLFSCFELYEKWLRSKKNIHKVKRAHMGEPTERMDKDEMKKTKIGLEDSLSLPSTIYP